MVNPPVCTPEQPCVICLYNAGKWGTSDAEAKRFQEEYLQWDKQRNRASRALLRSFLSRSQRDTLSKDGYFIVTGSLGGKYRVYTWLTINNVFKYNPRSGVVLARYCMDVLSLDPYHIPRWDIYLAQAIQLVTDEKGFWTKANKAAPAPRNVAFIDARYGPYSKVKRSFPENG